MGEKLDSLKVDLVIEGNVYLRGSLVRASIGVDQGKIVSISKPSLAPIAERRISYGDKYLILPGMVDIHVHMREPGLEYKEDWASGSRAAIKGGVTTVFDMPNNKPRINSCERLKEKIRLASSKSLVDFGLYMGLPDDPSSINDCKDLYVGFKIYPEDYAKEELREVFQIARNLDKIVVIHPEDPALLLSVVSMDYSNVRPPEAEISAVKRMLKYAAEMKVWIHFTHVSTAMSVREILKAKLRTLKITFDVTPHHMLLNSKLYKGKWAKIAKVNPPLRSEADRAVIYRTVESMFADAIASDHAPHALKEKLNPNFEDVPPGFPGLETTLHLLLKEIIEGRMELDTIDLYSSRPARLFGLRKGEIRIGWSADFAIVKIGEEWVIKSEDFESKAKYSPFEGWKLRTKTWDVYLRGELVYSGGEFLREAGGGRLVSRSFNKTLQS